MKRYLLLLSMFLLTFSLVGCWDKDSPTVNKEPTLIKGDKSPKSNQEIIREDEDKLVKVRIKDGEANISFDLERWEELHNIYGYDPEFYPVEELQEGPFAIAVESGKVVDACIGKLNSMDYSSYEFTLPVVVLLMDDDSVEWIWADPFRTADLSYIGGEYEYFSNFISHGTLAYKDKFISCSYESDGEGIGNMAIYLINDHNIKFDFYSLRLETNIKDGVWISEIIPPVSESDSPILGHLKISPDGKATFDVGIGGSSDDYKLEEIFESWSGNADVITATDQQYPLGTLIFDLSLDYCAYQAYHDLPNKIKGSYRVDLDSSSDITLFHNDGDVLYQLDEDIMGFTFFQFWYD